jgi:demethylmenaquinone methyltransferase/2-methoxy-6-polyprenyl-1,4-benzoquinol methylase
MGSQLDESGTAEDRQRRPDEHSGGVRPHGVLPRFYSAPESRAGFVNELFDNSARDYDRLTRWLSFGTGARYRRDVLRRAGLRPGMRLLDVATGTGLVAGSALQLGLAPRQVVGLDPSRGMVEQNRARYRVPLVQGRGEHLPFADGVFDFVAMGYALRHVEDLGLLFAEFHRVLKPGGRALVLEISRPRSRVGATLLRWYMQRVLPPLARLVTGNRDAARLLDYYWETIAECVPPATIESAMAGAGFGRTDRFRFCGAMFNNYLGIK